MRKFLIILVMILVVIFLYGRYIEINNFKIREYTIENADIPASFEELKFVQFSDVLYEKNYNTKNLDRLVKEINKNEPDVVIFSGDLLKKNNKFSDEDYTLLKKYLTDIKANLYKYAVIGDNDQEYLDIYKDILYESNFILLDNENKLFFYKDETPINIIGITNTNSDISNLLNTDVAYNYSLAITHEPDNFEYLSQYDINTILSGHSLGGVINLPFYKGIIKKNGARTYINDYYTLNNSEIFISNGLGYEKFNFRLFNTPSINIYRFSQK